MDQMTIKTCIALFDSSSPEFFEPCERDTFEEFLKHRFGQTLLAARLRCLHNLSISRVQMECLKIERYIPGVEFDWANLNSSIPP